MSAETQDRKKALRREVRVRAGALTEDYRRAADAAVRQLILDSAAWRNARAVFVYVSMGAEPDTRRLLEDALAAGKALYVPLCRPGGVLEAVRIRGVGELRPGMRSIPEPPEDGEYAGQGSIDLALVPCVSAARDGRRLGHGVGYYDRFLADHSCRTICLCYEALLSDELPTDDHDVTMDAVATETGIWV